MFQPVAVDIRTSPQHGGTVLLDSYLFENGDLTIRVFAPGTGDSKAFRFSDVIGFTMTEQVFGPQTAPGQPDPKGNPADATSDLKPVFFQRSAAAPALTAVRSAMPAQTRGSVRNHHQFRLSLREYELTFLADSNYEIETVSQDTEN